MRRADLVTGCLSRSKMNILKFLKLLLKYIITFTIRSNVSELIEPSLQTMHDKNVSQKVCNGLLLVSYTFVLCPHHE